jgi:chromate transport protein ChrA
MLEAPMPSSPLLAFVRASSLHIGGAAAVASLRKDFVEEHGVEPRDIDAAYAVSRITPGTNLLAFYALLGHGVGGWPLAIRAVLAGAMIPAAIVLAVATIYSGSESRMLAAAMAGARAAGIAIICGSPVRLLRPQVKDRPAAAIALALGLFLLDWLFQGSPFALLLVAAGAGAVVLRPREALHPKDSTDSKDSSDSSDSIDSSE